MKNSSSINIVKRLQNWMDSVPGQTFLNYAYSWGAAVVILGTLFKLTHLPGANLMLFLGMGTEVVVFFLSAFDRPFDKNASDRELSEFVPEDGEEMPEGVSVTGQSAVHAGGGIVGGGFVVGGGAMPEGNAESAAVAGGGVAGGVVGGGGSTVIIGGGGGGFSAAGTNGESGASENTEASIFTPSEGLQNAAAGAGIPAGSLAEIIQMANEELLHRAQASLTPEMEEASREYAEKLKLLTETLDRVEKQSARLTTDSEEMTNLNRTLTGINTIYELQLKSISAQVGSIDRINEQTRHMAEQIEQLNNIYARMIKALTVNMKNTAGAIDEQ